MKMIGLFLFAALSIPVVFSSDARRDIGSLTTYSTQVVPLVIVGEGWSQKMVVSNVDDKDPATGTVRFFRSDGRRWNIPMVNRGSESVHLINLQPGGTAIFETEVRNDPQELGWALIELNSGGLGDIFGQSIFRKQTLGRPDFMTSTPFTHYAFDRLHVFFDNLGDKYAGVGILLVDTCDFSCTDQALRVRFRNLDGSIISETTKAYKEGTLNWFSLSAEFPEVIGKVGTLEVEPVQIFTVRIAGFSLQFAPNGAFTSVASFEN